jgi:hypothetical protein
MLTLLPYMQARIDALRALGFSATAADYIVGSDNTRAYQNQYDINPRIAALTALGFTFVCALALLAGHNGLAVQACDLWRRNYNYHSLVRLGQHKPIDYRYSAFRGLGFMHWNAYHLYLRQTSRVEYWQWQRCNEYALASPY